MVAVDVGSGEAADPFASSSSNSACSSSPQSSDGPLATSVELATAASSRICASTSWALPSIETTSMPTTANWNVGTSGRRDGANRNGSSTQTLVIVASPTVAPTMATAPMGVIAPTANGHSAMSGQCQR